LETSTLHNPLRYTGRIPDESLGLYDFRTRAPQIGRFLQRDNNNSPNLYTFVNNNPLISIDPLGKDRLSADTYDNPDRKDASFVQPLSLLSNVVWDKNVYAAYTGVRNERKYGLLSEPWIGYALH
jgi:RHS repeat-associated protein